ncbi:MAG: galactokinase [Desulfobacterales bacterium]
MTNSYPDENIRSSAPCRIDMGGTLDISTFYLSLQHLNPCTFNAAIGLRTQVSLLPYKKGYVRVSSTGFESAEFTIDTAPYDHPLGLVFAIAAYFRLDGIHICIDSSSPPRSALGGSSSAAVALVAACYAALQKKKLHAVTRDRIAFLAHAIEQSVAGVPCGIQDQLAAAHGGLNTWYWNAFTNNNIYHRKALVGSLHTTVFQKHIIIAYCGVPHESKDINSRWVKRFVSGVHRTQWKEIIFCTQSFVDALLKENYKEASRWMNRETEIRCNMTPDVLDDMGRKLAKKAIETDCGTRFTGAGGGGCLWAIGEAENIRLLRSKWKTILAQKATACLLDGKIDEDGLWCSHLSFDQ